LCYTLKDWADGIRREKDGKERIWGGAQAFLITFCERPLPHTVRVMPISVRVKSATPVLITTEEIKLDAFLKFCGAVSTGGQAKMLIADGRVRLNGQICTQRGKTLVCGDKVSLGGGYWQVAAR
jgi:ribosome-associated protein